MGYDPIELQFLGLKHVNPFVPGPTVGRIDNRDPDTFTSFAVQKVHGQHIDYRDNIIQGGDCTNLPPPTNSTGGFDLVEAYFRVLDSGERRINPYFDTEQGDRIVMYDMDICEPIEAHIVRESQGFSLQSGPPLFFEGFDSVFLDDSNEKASRAQELPLDGFQVWSEFEAGKPQAGWTIANDVSNGGVKEWTGWSLADKDWWAAIADNEDGDPDDEGRAQFFKGVGPVMVADADEWFDSDAAEAFGYFTRVMSPPHLRRRRQK